LQLQFEGFYSGTVCCNSPKQHSDCYWATWRQIHRKQIST